MAHVMASRMQAHGASRERAEPAACRRPDPLQRITIAGIVRHPWFLEGLPPGLDVDAFNMRPAQQPEVCCSGSHGCAAQSRPIGRSLSGWAGASYALAALPACAVHVQHMLDVASLYA